MNEMTESQAPPNNIPEEPIKMNFDTKINNTESGERMNLSYIEILLFLLLWQL